MSTLISYPDRTLAATLTGSDFSNLDNLKNPLLSKVARTANVTGTKTINIDLGADRAIQVVSLCGHNLTKDASIRVRGYSDSGYTTLVSGADSGLAGGNAPGPDMVINGDFSADTSWAKNTGWTISGGSANANAGANVSMYQTNGVTAGKTYKVTFTISALSSGGAFVLVGNMNGVTRTTTGTFEEYITALSTTYHAIAAGASGFVGSVDNFSIKEMTFSPAWPSGFTAQNVTDYPKNWTYCFSSAKNARYWKIEIVDTTNPAGYIELGRCWLGEAAFAPALGISYGLSLGYESKDIISESLGGIPWGEKRTPRRSLVATFNTLTAAEKRQAIIMQKVLTETTEAFFVTDTGAAAEDMLIEAFPCFLSKPSPIQYPYYNNNVLPIQVVERV